MSKNYARSYSWAANPLKLNEAITDLENAKKLDPSVVISEDTIKERYIVRKGEVLEAAAPETEAAAKPKAPKVARVSTNKPKAPKKEDAN